MDRGGDLETTSVEVKEDVQCCSVFFFFFFLALVVLKSP